MTTPALASRITSVTVFRSGALVTRVAELDIATSVPPERVRLSGLPLSLDDSSVKVRIESSGDGTPPIASDVRVALDVIEPDPDLAPPRDQELDDARLEVARLGDRIAQAAEKVERLEGLAPPDRPDGAPGKAPPPSPSSARLALLDFRHTESEQATAQLRDLRRQHDEAKERLVQLEDRHRRATSARQARPDELRKSLVVRMRPPGNGPGAHSCRLVVEYLVPGARWAPSYAVRLGADMTGCELELRGVVCQASGEDWNGVALTLSTAEAQRWTELPDLPALRIGRRQPEPPRTGWREPPEGADALFADYDQALSKSPQPAPAPPEEITDALHVAAALEENVMMKYAMPAAGAELMDDMLLETEPEAEPPAEAAGMAAPAPMVAAAKEASVTAQRFVKRSRRGAPAPARPLPSDPGPPPSSALVAPADLLDYGRLSMGSAGDRHRGVLRPARVDETYVELLAHLHVEVSFDVVVVVQEAVSRAAVVVHKDPPSGHVVPGSWQGFDFAYPADRPVDVPSDGSFHAVTLLSRSASTGLRYVAVPRQGPEAFRFVAFTNPLDAPLPSGPVDVSVGGDFLLTSRLHTVAPEGEVELGLGVDEAIKIARNARFEEHTSGLLGGSLKLEHEVEVEVANHLPRAAYIEVRERVPVTRKGDDEVEVEVTDTDPAWERYEQSRRPVEGAYRWRVTVPPSATKTLRARYVITLSAKHELVGGNRREP